MIAAEKGTFIKNQWNFSNVKFHNLLTNEIIEKIIMICLL